MNFKSLCLFSLLWCITTLGVPAEDPVDDPVEDKELSRRQNTQANPYAINFDTTNWPNIAEENCYAMLCLFNGNRVYRRVATKSAIRKNRRKSGARLMPFDVSLARRGTNQINTDTVSAEEFPWASTTAGGSNAAVFPATTEEQTAQGGTVGSALVNSPASYNDWFRITFTSSNSLGQYCTALQSNPPDTSLCTSTPKQTLFGTKSVIIANYAYRVVTTSTYFTFIHLAGSKAGKVGQLKRRDYEDDEDDSDDADDAYDADGYDWSVLDAAEYPPDLE